MRYFLAIMLLASSAQASPYFRLIDPTHPRFGAGFLVSPKVPTETMAITDLALITHSTEDGTIVPESWQTFIPPESWTPLQLGFGGSFNGTLTIAPGMSANVAPILAALLLHGVSHSSSGAAQAVKTAMEGRDSGGFRLGGALAGVLLRDGQFQSAKAAFPGQGFLDIVGNAARVNVGYSWNF